jgi:hypothetical protein
MDRDPLEIDLELIDLVPRRNRALDDDAAELALHDILLDHLMHERSAAWRAQETRRRRDIA